MDTNLLGKGLILFGVFITMLGLLFIIVPRIPGLGWLGKLPGDFVFQSGSIKVFAPLATCLLLSLIITFILNIVFSHK